MAYTKINYANDQTPALSAENLNHMDQGIYDAHVQISSLDNDTYSKTEIDDSLDDIYTKEESDANYYDKESVYTKEEVNATLENYYTKEETYSKSEVLAKEYAVGLANFVVLKASTQVQAGTWEEFGIRLDQPNGVYDRLNISAATQMHILSVRTGNDASMVRIFTPTLGTVNDPVSGTSDTETFPSIKFELRGDNHDLPYLVIKVANRTNADATVYISILIMKTSDISVLEA